MGAALLMYCAAILLTDAAWLRAMPAETLSLLFLRGDILAPALLIVFFLLAKASLKRGLFVRSDAMLCLVLALLFLLGRLLLWDPENNVIARLVNQPVPSLAAVAGFALFLLILLYWGRIASAALCDSGWRLSERFLRHPMRNTFLLLIICWSPYIITRWPAAVEYDAYVQILQMNGFSQLTGASPVASTFLIGGLVRLGWSLFHSWNVGLIAFVLLQIGICAWILSYSIFVMNRMGVPKGWCLVSAVVYGVCPLFPCCTTTVVKDSLFACVTVLFVVLLAQFLLTGEAGEKSMQLLPLGCVAFLACILRNNGVCYVLIPGVAAGIHLIRKRESAMKRLFLCLTAALVLYGGYCYVLFGALDIPQGSADSALTIPFQQTARFVKYYPEDVTADEARVIDAVLDFDQLAELYEPEVSDPVKATFHGDREDLRRYFGVWFRQFLKRPACYVQATLLNSYPYYYPGNGLVHVYIGKNHGGGGPIVFASHRGLYPAADALAACVYKLDSGLLLPLCSIGLQTWVLLYLLAGAIKRRDSCYLMLLLPSLVGVLICIGCPAYRNGNAMRYASPYVFANPFLIGIWLRNERQRQP